jgi:hypothetical protein
MEKLSLNPRRVALGGVVVALAVAVVLLLRMTGNPDSPTSGDGKQAATADGPGAKHAVSRSLPGAPPPPSIEQPPPMPDELIARILKKDKRLGLFMDYHKIVLLDATRRDEYRKLLSSIEMMTAMAEDLMNPGTGQVDPEEYYRRLMQIDYFEAALTWKDNPQREKLLALTGEVIGKDNFSSDQNSARRQMLGGSKMELYRLMYEQDAQKADGLVAQAKGTRMEPLVTWMAGEELRRRTREEEIRKEVEDQQAKAN